MRIVRTPVLLALLAAPLLAGEGIPWMSDLDQARTLAAANGRLVMVDFTAKW